MNVFEVKVDPIAGMTPKDPISGASPEEPSTHYVGGKSHFDVYLGPRVEARKNSVVLIFDDGEQVVISVSDEGTFRLVRGVAYIIKKTNYSFVPRRLALWKEFRSDHAEHLGNYFPDENGNFSIEISDRVIEGHIGQPCLWQEDPLCEGFCRHILNDDDGPEYSIVWRM